MVDKQRNQHYPLVPISIILSALKEDPISIKMILKHYHGYIKSSPDSCVKCYTMFLPFLLIKIDVFS
ncbi:helix-turn-helix domain-containing protein [Enterococcus faecalis]